MPEGVGYGPQDSLSVGLNLNVIGNHAYAYSGGYGAVDVSAEWFNFTTGDFVTVGTFQLNTPVKPNTPLDVAGLVAVIKMNGIVICNLVVNPQGSPETTQPAFATQDLVIPPYTHVTVDVVSDAEDVDDIGSATFTARIYK